MGAVSHCYRPPHAYLQDIFPIVLTKPHNFSVTHSMGREATLDSLRSVARLTNPNVTRLPVSPA